MRSRHDEALLRVASRRAAINSIQKAELEARARRRARRRRDLALCFVCLALAAVIALVAQRLPWPY